MCVCVICAFEFVIIPEDLEGVKRQHVPKPVRRKDICTTTVFSLRPLRMLACSAIDFKKMMVSTWLPVSYASKSHVTQLSLAVSFPSLSNLCPSKWSLWTLPAFGNRFYRPIIPAIQKYLQSYYPSHMNVSQTCIPPKRLIFQFNTIRKICIWTFPFLRIRTIHVFFHPTCPTKVSTSTKKVKRSVWCVHKVPPHQVWVPVRLRHATGATEIRMLDVWNTLW